MGTLSTKARVNIEPNGVVKVRVNANTLYDLGAMQQVQASVLGRLGCPGCTSGIQFIFQQEEGEFGVG
jgi:hypothetical protein